LGIVAVAAGFGEHLAERITLKVGDEGVAVIMLDELARGVVVVALLATIKAGFLDQAFAAVVGKVVVFAIFVGESGEVAFFVVVVVQGLAVGVGAGDDLRKAVVVKSGEAALGVTVLDQLLVVIVAIMTGFTAWPDNFLQLPGEAVVVAGDEGLGFALALCVGQ